jgi:hypothetical protein
VMVEFRTDDWRVHGGWGFPIQFTRKGRGCGPDELRSPTTG